MGSLIRFPLDRARPSKAGRIVCCADAEVVILTAVRIERDYAKSDGIYAEPMLFEMTTGGPQPYGGGQ